MASLGDVLLVKKLFNPINFSGPNSSTSRISVYANNIVITSGVVSGNTYLRRKVYLIIDDMTMRVYQTAYTNNTTGALTFYNIPPGRYKLIIEGNKNADDPGASFASQVFDNIVVI